MKKIKPPFGTPGDILKVPFDPPFHTYALVTVKGVFWYYDLKTTEDIADMEAIRNSSVLFKLHTNRYLVIETYIFPIVGHVTLTEEESIYPNFMLPDLKADTSRPYWRIVTKDEIRPAEAEEVRGLEPCIAFDERYIYGRLRAHYANELYDPMIWEPYLARWP
jgi:Immunity protein 26